MTWVSTICVGVLAIKRVQYHFFLEIMYRRPIQLLMALEWVVLSAAYHINTKFTYHCSCLYHTIRVCISFSISMTLSKHQEWINRMTSLYIYNDTWGCTTKTHIYLTQIMLDSFLVIILHVPDLQKYMILRNVIGLNFCFMQVIFIKQL